MEDKNEKSAKMPITGALKGLFPVIYWAAAIYMMLFHPMAIRGLSAPIGLLGILFCILPAPVALGVLATGVFAYFVR